MGLVRKLRLKKWSNWGLPGGPVVKTPRLHASTAGGVGPGQGTKIQHAVWGIKKKKKWNNSFRHPW